MNRKGVIPVFMILSHHDSVHNAILRPDDCVPNINVPVADYSETRGCGTGSR